MKSLQKACPIWDSGASSVLEDACVFVRRLGILTYSSIGHFLRPDKSRVLTSFWQVLPNGGEELVSLYRRHCVMVL